MKVALFVSALLASLTAASAQSTNTIPLWLEGAPGALGNRSKDAPTLTPFWPTDGKANGATMIVCPGGGYGILSGYEGRDYALWLNQQGITCFVLNYRLGGSGGYHHPAMLQDVTRAVRLVRSNAREWKLDPARVGIIGSSAGGHLASTLLTRFDSGNPRAADPVERVNSRPDLAVLCYPVITMGALSEKGSREKLLGKNPSPELVNELSSELHVTTNTPPCFIWSTFADTLVPMENSLLFAEALRKAHVPFDLHIYQQGKHGLGLGKSSMNPVRHHPWTDDCLYWLHVHGFLDKNAVSK
jgi:acetyl esterase/lipase